MTRADQIVLLRQAAAAVIAVADAMDDSEEQCPTCALWRRTNWTEFRAGTELDGIAVKLARIAENLQNAEGENAKRI